jgi:hypothetical protein
MEQTYYPIEIRYFRNVKMEIIKNIVKQIKKLNETEFTCWEKQLQQKYQDELYIYSLVDYKKQTQKMKDYNFEYLKNILASKTEKSNIKYYRFAELNQIRCELNNYNIDENFNNDESEFGKYIKYILKNYIYE